MHQHPSIRAGASEPLFSGLNRFDLQFRSAEVVIPVCKSKAEPGLQSAAEIQLSHL